MHQPYRLHVGQLRTLAVAPIALAFMSFAGSGLCAQEGAPAGTIQVEAHASKWDYPKELKVPEGSRTHMVQKGDTLWDLANKYLGNPYAWPQIWENNQWIKDPHWIYPGDPLIIDLSKGVAKDALPDAVGDLQPDQRRIDPSVLRRPELGFAFQDFIQLPFVAAAGAEAHFKAQGAFTITSNLREDHQFLAEGETIFLNGGSEQGVKTGDRFLVLRIASRKLFHPLHRKQKMGDVLQQIGVVRIINPQAKGSEAVIERCMDSIQKGDHLVRFTEPANIPTQLRTDTTDPIKIGAHSAVVIWSRDNHMNTAGGDMTLIDRGADDGLKVGDVLLAARTTTFSVGKDGQKKPPTETTTHYLGQVLVVKVEAKTATCRVLRSNEELRNGDIISR